MHVISSSTIVVNCVHVQSLVLQGDVVCAPSLPPVADSVRRSIGVEAGGGAQREVSVTRSVAEVARLIHVNPQAVHRYLRYPSCNLYRGNIQN